MRISRLGYLLPLMVCLACEAKEPEPELTIVVREDTERINEAKSRLELERQDIIERKKDLDDLERNIRKLSETSGKSESEELQVALSKLQRLQGDMKRLHESRRKDLDMRSQELELTRKALDSKPVRKNTVAGRVNSADLEALRAGQGELRKELSGLRTGMAGIEAQLRVLSDRLEKMPTTVAPMADSGASLATGKVIKRRTAERARRQAQTLMRKRGLLVSDLPPALQSHNAAMQKALSGGDYASAYDLAEQLKSAIKAIKIDGGFIDRKMKRLDLMRREKPPAANVRAEFDQRFETATRLFTDGQYERANGEINHLFRLVSG